MIFFIAISMAVLLVLGFPLYITMILTTLLTFVIFISSMDLSMVVQQTINGISTYVLLAIPMFIFAANIMTAGQTATRLVNFVKAFIGHIYGGLGISLAGACTIFGAISGSTQATVVAIGKPMRSNLIQSGYKSTDVNALIVSSANLAALIPPSIGMIIYCVLTGVSVGEMFMAGVGPGIAIFLMFAIYSYFHARIRKIPRTSKTSWREKLLITRSSLLPLGFPVVILGGIYSGIFSPTEAAAISVVYALICEMFIYKSVKLKDLYKIALSTGAVTAVVFILIAVGQAFSWLITYARIPQELTTLVLGDNPSAIKILIIVSIFFFVACMFVDPIVATLILVPIFYPVAVQAGVDPIHLGIIVVLQSAIGGVTPPFGANLFTASAAFNEPFANVVKGTPPYLLMFIIFSIVIIFVPEIATIYRFFM